MHDNISQHAIRRRSLLGGLAALPLMMVRGETPVPARRRTVVAEVYVAGASRFSVSELMDRYGVCSGRKLRLFSSYAAPEPIFVLAPDGRSCIGQIPLAASRQLRPLIARGDHLDAVVVEMRDKPFGWDRLRVAIRANGSRRYTRIAGVGYAGRTRTYRR